MSKKLKNLILFGIFIVILFISTLSAQFSTDVLWSDKNTDSGGFNGLLFKNPVEISDLIVSRSMESKDSKDLVRYDVEFLFSGEESSLRILGTPVRQIFFEEGIEPSHSIVNLKGDYDKINDQLFNEKLKHADLYKKIDNYQYKANSEIRVPLNSDVEKYAFSIYYEPRELLYKNVDVVSKNSVFISKVSLLNNNSSIIFIVSIILVLILIWLDKKKFKNLYSLLLLLILLTFHRFFGLESSTKAILLILPILAYIGTCIARLMGNSDDRLMISKKELKQNLGYTIIFMIVTLIICIIPRAI